MTFRSCTFFVGDYPQEATSAFAIGAAGISLVENER